MDVFSTLIKEFDERVSQIKDYMSEGRVENFEDYKKLCGEIKGLLFARGYTLDLQRNLEESDE